MGAWYLSITSLESQRHCLSRILDVDENGAICVCYAVMLSGVRLLLQSFEFDCFLKGG